MMTKELKTDSVSAIEERHARLTAESARLAKEEAKAEERRQEKQAVRDMAADDADAAMLEKQAYLLTDLGSRDQLLEKVRRMRLETPENTPPAPPPLTEFQRQQLEIEQQAGREAVARAEKQQEEVRAWREKLAAEERAREGTMVGVHHPNPGMQEQFPANKATLGKTK
jgi:hypothetical protein